MSELRGGLPIQCHDVTHIYMTPEGPLVALRGVDLDVEAGSIVALMGASGTGKSTLLNLLGGLLQPSAGSVTIGSYHVSELRPREVAAMRARVVAIVLQEPTANLLSYATPKENIAWVRRSAREGSETFPEPEVLLGTLGLSALADQRVATMSGGEQQRVALACALGGLPQVLLVDEPTSQLEGDEREMVIEQIHRINQDFGTTIVLVTHDDELARRLPRTVVIRDGRVAFESRAGRSHLVVGADRSVRLPEESDAFPITRGTRIDLESGRGQIVLRPTSEYEGEEIARG
ncbi:MAG: ABC transporter ATP-binding protein [Acidimicrobiales bacterium]